MLAAASWWSTKCRSCPVYAILESEGGALCQVPDESGQPERLAAFYVNFLIVNSGIIVPGFDEAIDSVVRELRQTLFPEWEVVTVPGREILLPGDNIPCTTHQQPRP